MQDSESSVADGVEIRTYFVRDRNALVARGDFGDLFVDYYLHLHDHGMRHEPETDQLLKDTLSAIILHSASRPWSETVAWTISLQNPLLNLFASADNRLSTVAGNLFTENVKKNDTNLFYSDLVRGSEPNRRSVVTFEGGNIFRAVEEYYRQSEQRPARYFQLDDEDFVFVSAQPDCDVAWFNELDDDAIAVLDQTETLSLLETRRYHWQCGCSEEKLLPMLASAMKTDPEGLFGGEEAIRVSCPRCGAVYIVTRLQMEEFGKS